MTDSTWETTLPKMLSNVGISVSKIDRIVPLKGGVSSDIVRFRVSNEQVYCAKRALPQLKVAEDWEVPLERNKYEVAWLRMANAIHAGSAPKVIADSNELGIVILEYLPAEDYVNWKSDLLSGHLIPDVFISVGRLLGGFHVRTLNDSAIAERFPADALFDALRLDPYLRFTAGVHRDLSEKILAVLDTAAKTKIALVHGDFSPKNILISNVDGHPVILDAECAWYGDPAFDAAFCLNHFLLKSVHIPEKSKEFLSSAALFYQCWIECFASPLRQQLDQRVARLLPCLLLARVDGKSPAEYLTKPQRSTLRNLSRQLIASEIDDVSSVMSAVGELAKVE